MNILTDKLPKTISAGGKQYPIETDFRAGIAFEMMLEKGEKNILKILKAFFPDGVLIPDYETLEKIFDATLLYYRCGEKLSKKGKTAPTKQPYSFENDSSVIFADFWNYYNIDLSQEGLHWWAFRSLLDGLPDESEFKQRVYYRTCDTKGLSKKEKERILKIRSKIE